MAYVRENTGLTGARDLCNYSAGTVIPGGACVCVYVLMRPFSPTLLCKCMRGHGIPLRISQWHTYATAGIVAP